MKRFLGLALVVSLLLSLLVPGVSALTFKDLSETHWAYGDVQSLVKEGTVSGYVDGTFRPNGTVTRAEFVKMLGKTSVIRSKNYNDITAEHWAYPYVMAANFPEDGSNNFLPDQPITRGLVAELLWMRAGKKEGAFAPSIITSQYSKNKEAIAWIYTTGIMQGDDGVHLRLNETLSRAEAAALILRSRNAGPADKAFIDVVNPKILENAYIGLNLFDGKAYAPNATITNGEMARAAMRIGSEETVLTFVGLGATANFEHPYALEVSYIARNCLGDAKATASFADKKATFGDAVASLTYQFIYKSKIPVAYGKVTNSLPSTMSKMENICLTFAKDNGIITLNENLTAPITVREFTAICVLLDSLIGSQTDITTDIHPITGKYVMNNHSLFLTDLPYGNFRVKLNGIPSFVYGTPFVHQVSAPVETYNFAREYSSIFTSLLRNLKASVYERSGADIRLTYYPSLVCDNGNGYTMRLACQILKVDGNKTFKDLFVTAQGMNGANTPVYEGQIIYFDLATGEQIKSIYMTDDKAYVEQIVR